MTLRELIDQIEIQGKGIIQIYNERTEDVKKIYEWEYDLNDLPEELENLFVHYMWASYDGMVIEVSKER